MDDVVKVIIKLSPTIISALSIIATILVAIIPPALNHKKKKQYDKQWEVIAELYKKIADTDIDVETFLSPLQDEKTKSEIEKRAVNSFDSLARYFLGNKIYIPEDIATLVDLYIQEVGKNFLTNRLHREGDAKDPEIWYKTWEKHRDGSIRESKEKIEKMFRKYLKIKNGTSHALKKSKIAQRLRCALMLAIAFVIISLYAAMIE